MIRQGKWGIVKRQRNIKHISAKFASLKKLKPVYTSKLCELTLSKIIIAVLMKKDLRKLLLYESLTVLRHYIHHLSSF